MLIYINEDGGLTNNPTSIPINLETEIYIAKSFDTGEKEISYINDYPAFISSTGEITNEKYSYIKKSDKVEDFVKFEDVDLDENIYESRKIGNAHYFEKILNYKKEKLTEDNLELFDIGDVLEQEHRNILNKTNYDYLISDIIEDVDDINSKYRFKNRYKIILGPNDFIKIKLINIPNMRKFCIKNINKNLTLFANNKKIIYNRDFAFEFDLRTNNLTLEIMNNTEKNISIIDPYVFCN